ncbi:NADH-ubiquinone oxidoreductase chain 6 (mitochondrion) [[Candida] railenensis]|uniref:NADH-ubiquinone oxidoreductase chain 6 n=1 Tax=[Candida] railenensis TaxID=45579 RepID=UPI002028D5D6|nr:NADH-ubiquinone oxidoreductase chain 6 [[Candida] railenensis]CAH2356118.1 NADH-ubiquinone oxidoreductase chain 6 [[Candida] railenensis]
MNTISGISSMLAIGLLSPVQSMLCMIMLFVAIAMSLYSQGFMLMGMLYIMMYVGAMAMTFLFMLSLLKIDYSNKNSISSFILTFLIILFMPLDLSYESIGMSETVFITYNETITVGSLLYTDYALLTMITGLMLMLSVMGAISMTK